jgi:hypothetical protein
MTLTDALKIPGVWWAVLKSHPYPPNGQPTKVEVVEVLDDNRQSDVRIADGEITRIDYSYHHWEAYPNYWLAWAAVQRSKAHD